MKNVPAVNLAELKDFAGFAKVLLSIKGFYKTERRQQFIEDFLQKIKEIDISRSELSADDVAKFKVNSACQEHKKALKVLGKNTDTFSFFNVVLGKVAELVIKEIKLIKDLAEIIPIYQKAREYFFYYNDNLGNEFYSSFDNVKQEIINILENETIPLEKRLLVIDWFISEGWSRFEKIKYEMLVKLGIVGRLKLVAEDKLRVIKEFEFEDLGVQEFFIKDGANPVGQHFHREKFEIFCFLDGHGIVRIAKVDEAGGIIGKIERFEVEPGFVFKVKPYHTHRFDLDKNTKFMVFSSKPFDQNDLVECPIYVD